MINKIPEKDPHTHFTCPLLTELPDSMELIHSAETECTFLSQSRAACGYQCSGNSQ